MSSEAKTPVSTDKKHRNGKFCLSLLGAELEFAFDLNEANENLVDNILRKFFGENALDNLIDRLKVQHDNMRYPTELRISYNGIVVSKRIIFHKKFSRNVMLDALKELTSECLEKVLCSAKCCGDESKSIYYLGVEDLAKD